MDDHIFLVERAKNNDLSAFEELVRIYQKKVYALCLHLSGNNNDAQDLAQESFIKAFQGLRSFRNDANFGTWLHRITVNVWLNYRRKNNTYTISLDEPYQGEDGSEVKRDVVAGNGDPLQMLEEKEFRSLVFGALNSLSEEHRLVLILREIEGYSYDEVSKILGCSLGTVKSRLSRARDTLRRIIIIRAQEAGQEIPHIKKEG